jgi:cell division septation protein DedD
MNKIRLAGWLAVGGLLGGALLAPSAVFATDLKDSQQGTSWDDPDFQGSAEDCEGLDLAPGEVVWHFVLTDPDADSGHLTATFDDAGDVTVENADSPAAVLHFFVTTGHDTLLDAETTDVDGKNLVLSHICAGEEEESESVPVETESVPVETESVPVETESVPVETDTPDGSVEAETGTPEEDVTPPSTDTLTPTNTPSNDGWQLVLIALAALLATALILTPASRKVRR